MTEGQATSKADDALRIILTHQPNLFGAGNMLDADNARAMAEAVAAFRQELVAQYLTQPV